MVLKSSEPWDPQHTLVPGAHGYMGTCLVLMCGGENSSRVFLGEGATAFLGIGWPLGRGHSGFREPTVALKDCVMGEVGNEPFQTSMCGEIDRQNTGDTQKIWGGSGGSQVLWDSTMSINIHNTLEIILWYRYCYHLFYCKGNWSTERLSNFLSMTQLISESQDLNPSGLSPEPYF